MRTGGERDEKPCSLPSALVTTYQVLLFEFRICLTLLLDHGRPCAEVASLWNDPQKELCDEGERVQFVDALRSLLLTRQQRDRRGECCKVPPNAWLRANWIPEPEPKYWAKMCSLSTSADIDTQSILIRFTSTALFP